MEWVFWIFNFSERALYDQITSVVQTIYRPDLCSASVCGKESVWTVLDSVFVLVLVSTVFRSIYIFAA